MPESDAVTELIDDSRRSCRPGARIKIVAEPPFTPRAEFESELRPPAGRQSTFMLKIPRGVLLHDRASELNSLMLSALERTTLVSITWIKGARTRAASGEMCPGSGDGCTELLPRLGVLSGLEPCCCSYR